ncbi:MAG: glycosyltransferase [Planctomycetota bacterium]|nr:MAG: glycosyltransferase [Planctomycetota bacterium]
MLGGPGGDVRGVRAADRHRRRPPDRTGQAGGGDRRLPDAGQHHPRRAGQPSPDPGREGNRTGPRPLGRDHAALVRLLAVYRGLPWPIGEGYHLRVLHLFRRLARRHQVHLLALVHEEAQRAKLPALADQGIFASIRLEELPRRRWLARAGTNFGLPAARSLLREFGGAAGRLGRLAADLRRDLGLDAGYVFDPWADVLWHEGGRELPTLLDVCDCRTLYYDRLLAAPDLGLGQRLRTLQLRRRFRALERFALRAYPVATAVSPQDREALLRLAPEARVEVVPNGVDLAMFSPDPAVAEDPLELLTFGNMDFQPNVDSAVRFARRILPLVRRRFPGVRFTVAGSNPAPAVQALAELDGVEVTGTVPELRPFINRAAMLVAPMRLGAGIKNKVLETLACGRPVVTSPAVAEALHPEAAAVLRLAENDEDFAAEVCRLLADPDERRRLGRRGREAMRRHHSWDAAATAYEALFAELAAGGATAPSA